MEVSMKDLFPACIQVLEDHRVPMHYRELTEKALKKIGIAPSHINFKKEIENVREKLLCAEQRGTFYTGAPLCMGGMKYWFKLNQLEFTVDFVSIPGDAQAGANGAFEALMRSPHMVIHNPSLKNTELLNRQRSSGLVLEHHVSEWFKAHYPQFYQEPDNFGKWHIPCNHDFKLVVDDEVLKIDVAGPDYRGEYGSRGRKKSTDVHLLCRILDKYCIFEGVVSGKDFNENVIPATAFSPNAFLVWLNCKKHCIDYASVVNSISRNTDRIAA